jgi:pimeloyl-ACP methyl ester carboxylesterase
LPTLAGSAASADAPVPDLRYDLAVGDHLVVRESLTQDVAWPDHERSTRAAWRAHVVVTGRTARGQLVVGISRIRTLAELTRYKERGRDQIGPEQEQFAQRLRAWPERFVEANVVDERGTPQLPWNAVREWWSEALFDFHEIAALPRAGAVPALIGSALGVTVRAVDRVETPDGPVWRLQARDPGEMRLRYDFKVASSLVTHVELDGRYLSPPNTQVHETLTYDLVERRRGESHELWLADEEVRPAVERAGAAAAIVTAPRPSGRVPQLPGTPILPVREGRYAGWPFIMRVPESYQGDRPVPLLVYLSGGPGRALSGALGSAGAIAQDHWLIAYPQAVSSWWDNDSIAMLDDLVDDLLTRFNVDVNRVFIAGVSNGATGAVRYATLAPQRFAAVVSLMGAGRKVPAQAPPYLANLSRLPILIVHGDMDPIIDIEASKDAAAALRKGAPTVAVELHVLKGRGHDIRPGSDDDLSLPFLLRAVRDPFPRSVHLVLDDMAHPRRYWLEVVEKERGTADVEAQIRDDNVLEMRCRGVRRLRLHLRPEMFPVAGPVRVEANGREVFSGSLPAEDHSRPATLPAPADPFLVAGPIVDVDLERRKP